MNDLILKTNTITTDKSTDTVDTEIITDTVSSDGTQYVTDTVDPDVAASDNAEAAVTEAMTGTDTATVATTTVDNTPAGLAKTLPLMGKGMVGIFMVTVAIILAVAVLNKLTTKK